MSRRYPARESTYYQHSTRPSYGSESSYATTTNPVIYNPASRPPLRGLPTLSFPNPRTTNSFYRIGWLGRNRYSVQKPYLGFQMCRTDPRHKFVSHLMDQAIKIWLTAKGRSICKEFIEYWLYDAAPQFQNLETDSIAHGWNLFLERILTDRSMFPQITLNFYLSERDALGSTEYSATRPIDRRNPIGHLWFHLHGLRVYSMMTDRSSQKPGWIPRAAETLMVIVHELAHVMNEWVNITCTGQSLHVSPPTRCRAPDVESGAMRAEAGRFAEYRFAYGVYSRAGDLSGFNQYNCPGVPMIVNSAIGVRGAIHPEDAYNLIKADVIEIAESQGIWGRYIMPVLPLAAHGVEDARRWQDVFIALATMFQRPLRSATQAEINRQRKAGDVPKKFQEAMEREIRANEAVQLTTSVIGNTSMSDYIELESLQIVKLSSLRDSTPQIRGVRREAVVTDESSGETGETCDSAKDGQHEETPEPESTNMDPRNGTMEVETVNRLATSWQGYDEAGYGNEYLDPDEPSGGIGSALPVVHEIVAVA